jgi:serine/threonine protein kinase
MKILVRKKNVSQDVTKNYVKYGKEKRGVFLETLIFALLEHSKKNFECYDNMKEFWSNCLKKERKGEYKETGEELEKFIEEIQLKSMKGEIKKFKKTKFTIGRGGTSSLFLGIECTGESEFKFLAIKYFKLEYNERAIKEGFFLTEKSNAKITNLLCHGFLFEKNNYYDQSYVQVMEYIDGYDLEYFIRKNRKFNEKKAKEIIKKIVKILKSLDIAHRDLKPANM